MSRASRHARALLRWREQAARTVFLAGIEMYRGESTAIVTCYRDALRLGVLTFDVYAARKWAIGATLYGRHWQAVARHMEPDEHGVIHGSGSVGERAQAHPGEPWPHLGDDPVARVAHRLLDTLDGRCPWAPSAPRQPSKCETCAGFGCGDQCAGGFVQVLSHGDGDDPCPNCRGTGRNLRGYLPAIEWPPSLRRKARDTANAIMDHGGRGYMRPHWLRGAYEAGREVGWTLCRPHATDGPGDPKMDARTRSVPRDEHRTGTGEPPLAFTGVIADVDVDAIGCQTGDHVRVRGYGKGRWAPRSTHAQRPDKLALAPRWRRGELRHERRRAASHDDRTP